MKSKLGTVQRLLPFLLVSLITGCAINLPEEHPPTQLEAPGVVPALVFYQALQRMSFAEMTRERAILASQPGGPGNQLRLAMLLGHPRGPLDINRALSLLDNVLKSSDPAAQSLQPLARVLADNYIERLKLDGQLDKQGLQMKESQRKMEESLRKVEESQRKALELQEKINSLADIERALAPRARTPRPLAPVGSK